MKTLIQTNNGTKVKNNAYARAMRQALANGCADYRGQRLTTKELGAVPTPLEQSERPRRGQFAGLDMLIRNCGGLGQRSCQF